MRIRITGSRSHRPWKCPASAVLPQIEQSEQSPMAGRGKSIHKFLEIARKVGRNEAIALAPIELRPLLECIDLDRLPAHVSTEVTLAWDWRARRGRMIGANLDRKHMIEGWLETQGIEPFAPDEIPLTADVMGGQMVNGALRGLIGDYKSGRTKYPSPDQFAQTMLGAVAGRSVHGFADCCVDLYYINDDGDTYPSRRIVDEWDMDAFEESFAQAMMRAEEYERIIEQGGTPDVVEGSHCDYCPAYKSCPAKLALVARMPVEIAEQRREPMTVARAGKAWLVIEAMEALIAEMKGEICGLAMSSPIQLPDGRVIEPVDYNRRELDAAKAIPIIRERYGDEAVSEAVTQKISLDALKDAVAKRRKPGETITGANGAFDRILADIERAGGLHHKRTTNVRPHVPKRR